MEPTSVVKTGEVFLETYTSAMAWTALPFMIAAWVSVVIRAVYVENIDEDKYVDVFYIGVATCILT